jgi:hypothetical protein
VAKRRLRAAWPAELTRALKDQCGEIETNAPDTHGGPPGRGPCWRRGSRLPLITGVVQRSPKCSRCLNWVKSDVLTVSRLLPVYPDQRTFSEPVGMSQRCHKRTHAPQQTPVILDQFARRRGSSDNADRTSQSNAISSTKSEFSFPESNLVVRDNFGLTLYGVRHLSIGVQGAV